MLAAAVVWWAYQSISQGWQDAGVVCVVRACAKTARQVIWQITVACRGEQYCK
jgi:hypothetical protein